MKLKIGIIYKITYPNGKIYIGQDRTDDINYFGSANGFIIEQDFTEQERQCFTITKEILYKGFNIEICELNRIEVELIKIYDSNDPCKGYNRYPGRQKFPHKTTLYESNQNQSA